MTLLEGKHEIGCHNCEYLQTESGAYSSGCRKHPQLVWPDTDEIVVCIKFKCRHELRSQPEYKELDALFTGKFKPKMKPKLIYTYMPHGNNPVLTAFPLTGGASLTPKKPSPDRK